jgi:hypothetical protein
MDILNLVYEIGLVITVYNLIIDEKILVNKKGGVFLSVFDKSILPRGFQI